MASSSSLHPQSNNRRENTGVLKPQQENKDFGHLGTKNHKTSTQLSKRDVENQDPNEAKSTKGGSKMLGVSRLPVLAKSLHSAAPGTSDETGHQRWEKRPLLGKVQKSKKCTKPVPFNFSQSRIHKQKSAEAPPETTTTSGITLTHLAQQLTINTPNEHRLQTNAKQSKDMSVGLKSPMCAESKLKHSNADEELLSYKVTASVQRDLSTQLESDGTNHKGSIQTLVSARLITENTVPFSPDPSALSSILNGKSCSTVGATPRVSICPSGRGTSIYSAQRVPIKRSQKPAAAATRPPGAESFSPDPSALRSILLNEGVKAGAVTTHRCSVAPSGRKTSIYSAQKVPVRKAQTEAATLVATVPFSPDPGALRSILLNEGVKVGGPAGTTPRVSVCPTGRGTLIYSAQRVPVRKPRAEEAGRNAQTPTLKGTPQRVPLSQSVRALVSRHKIPLVSESPGFGKSQAHDADNSVKQEEDVVQRLFQEEQECENEQMQKAGKEVSTCHSLQQHQPSETGLRLEDDSGRHSRLEEESKRPAAQPFIQAPHRQSVIVFSSGTRAQMPQDTGHAQPCVAQSADAAPPNEVAPPVALCKTKGLAAASSLSTAASVLRRRFPLDGELFLDDECAAYTSRQPSRPAQPRCINPVASLFLFQDSTCFMPISWTSSSLSPGSHLTSLFTA